MITVMRSDICALILAAGFSSRMGCIKPLLRINGDTMLDCTTKSLINAGIQSIYTVLGCYFDEIKAGYELKDSVHIVYNPDYADGMFTSVKAGVREMADRYAAFLMMPADCPGVSPETISRIVSAFPQEGTIIRPSYGGRTGHPCLISLGYKSEILSGDFSEGMRSFIQLHRDSEARIETDDCRILTDIDTLSDYKGIVT